jgi:hypothetical protein
MLPMLRNGPTPCSVCPKKSPEQAKEMMLTDQNWKVYDHYLQAKSVGMTDAERADPIVRRNFAVLDVLVKASHERELAVNLARELKKILPRS